MTRAHTVLAFDFGLKRIGIACGDTVTRQAAPRPATNMLRGSPDWDAIAREVRALAPRLLVVGAPYNAEGNEGTMLAAARRFAAELERRAVFEGYGWVTVRGLIHYLCSHDQQHLAGLQWLLGKMESP